MFNAPRLAQRYGTSPINGLGSSFVDEDPLAISIYDDPWSTAPTPSPPPVNAATSGFSTVIGKHLWCALSPVDADAAVADAAVPETYHTAFSAVDIINSGEVSVNALSRVLATSLLPAATIDRVMPWSHEHSQSLINLVDCKPSELEASGFQT